MHILQCGIGPASILPFSELQINLLAIVYTTKILGFDIGAACALAAVCMAIINGLVMMGVFRKEDQVKVRSMAVTSHKMEKT
ncbi:MAG: hypothetical protein HF976_14040 [ANME-2 cluster archaeon]|nr:hypothetical protein [ANME-2 cluster archaeon]MBC2702498.1 hypothetical protein [ANME-2 cluster archaeon]MBC2706795.1 hypothetical protein [ANME-2 cluster archaeon]MBC2747627.1 hypothetical protein [ANME-2 cluster archaeon]MBC2762572.1 hypothetical protein [ANME-2 cluster archaeon]